MASTTDFHGTFVPQRSERYAIHFAIGASRTDRLGISNCSSIKSGFVLSRCGLRCRIGMPEGILWRAAGRGQVSVLMSCLEGGPHPPAN